MFEFETSAQAESDAADPRSSLVTTEVINTEMECFRVVMDIRDELAMISSVFSEQERVIQSVMRTIDMLVQQVSSGADATRDPLHKAGLGIELWKKMISNIDRRAQVIEKALSHLLGLKLEVSNLLETEDSKEHLKSSKALLKINAQLLMSIDNLQKSSRALQDKADKQSGYLFAFTMVTVIFAPLSFVASFLAIPSRDFPQDGGVSWSQGQIGGGFDEF
ncbi:hypothetical protein LRP88_06381 [Fusarium phalaenopsidis]